MRIILIILSLTALVFVGWLATNIAGKVGDNSLNGTSQNQNSQNFSNDLTIEQLKHQLKTEQELSEIKAQLAQLTGTNTATTTQENTTTTTNSGEIIPVSAKFLGKILPTIELTKTENNGIFDLHTFDNTAYTTYSDEKFGMTVVASLLPYQTFLKNFQALDPNVYTVNTETPFPFDSFYVNPKTSDTLVRIVMKVEVQTLLITLPKSKFNTFKELILKEKS
ncbi:MAG: hypothetical protein Q4A35_02665 [Candidatus Gracilibacteria bacterium]|nr:hypothetical protein [Candidatus Gracilibacteria bacterium]